MHVLPGQLDHRREVHLGHALITTLEAEKSAFKNRMHARQSMVICFEGPVSHRSVWFDQHECWVIFEVPQGPSLQRHSFVQDTTPFFLAFNFGQGDTGKELVQVCPSFPVHDGAMGQSVPSAFWSLAGPLFVQRLGGSGGTEICGCHEVLVHPREQTPHDQ